MIVADQVKKIKEYLLDQEKNDQKESPCPLSDNEYRARLRTINDIRTTMNDVVNYCYDDGWDQDAVCSLIFKVAFGETWDDGLDWPSP